MRALLVLGLSILLFGAGCSDKEGILISTTSDMREPIYSLSFFVGSDTVAADDYFTRAKEVKDVIVDGRNLASEPFKLFLKPPASPEEADRLLLSDDIFVGVVAYGLDGETPVGYGFSDTLIFVPGKVLEWDVSIKPLDRGNGAGYQQVGDCLRWRTGPDTWIHIGGGTDKDCDGANTTDPEPDCDDTNPAIHPNADENCNNGFDDNCNDMVDGAEDADQDTYSPCAVLDDAWDCDDTDGQIYPMEFAICNNTVISCGADGPATNVGARCFATTAEGECRSGFLQCPDDGLATYCDISGGVPASVQECDAYETCDQPDPLICVPPPAVITSFCIIDYFRFDDIDDICIAANQSDTAEVRIPPGPVGCDTYELRNANALMRWEFTIEYGVLGNSLCDDANLRVRARNVQLPPAAVPLYIDARDENGFLVGTFKLGIESMENDTSCESASFSCGDAAGPWDSIPVPKN